MKRVPSNPWRTPAAVLLILLAMAAPCAARGTGGFLRDWAVCGPLEGTRLAVPALAPDAVGYPGLYSLGRVWLRARAEEDGRVDLRRLFPDPPTGTALAHTFFRVPADGTYVLRLGSDDAVRAEIDGRVLLEHDVRRPWRADAEEIVVELSGGWHRLLVRVVDYGAQWAFSVRVADGKNRPIEVPHQADPPAALTGEYRLDDAVTLERRAEATLYLVGWAEQTLSDLQMRRGRLEALPAGYVTFGAYSGARTLGLEFFDSLASVWRGHLHGDGADEPLEAASAAVDAAAGLSESLGAETRNLLGAMADAAGAWKTLGGVRVSERDTASAALRLAEVLQGTRRLADQVEKEHVLMARLESDIRNWRQRDLTVRVLDAEGGRIEGAEVEIVQTQHEFLFGCNAFALGQWGGERKNRLYEDGLTHLFNLVTVPLYWSAIEPRLGRREFGTLDRMLRWAEKKNLSVKGDPLLLDETVPRWTAEMAPSGAREAAESHVRGLVARYAGRVDWWDILTPIAGNIRVGPAAAASDEVVRWAASAGPKGGLILHDPDARRLAQRVAALQAAGLPVAGVGVLAHQHAGAWPVDLVRRTLDEAAAARLPVHVSAITILGGPDQETEQAEAVRRFYTEAFARPEVASISWWDLSDAFAWQNAPGGLLRADLSPKPAYEALDRLINHFWRTDAAGRTDEEGRIAVRAFFGSYRITARADRRSRTVDFHLTRDGPAEVDVVLPAAGGPR
ncbi:MAG TPA: endo-1,4-beta-xylanase [Phycisphaerae bacterium]|nr:endo-1,4-beta-xylanase [Phycisphaerae bacterium]